MIKIITAQLMDLKCNKFIFDNMQFSMLISGYWILGEMENVLITARIRRMGKVIFSLCVSVHTLTGGGGPRSQ